METSAKNGDQISRSRLAKDTAQDKAQEAACAMAASLYYKNIIVRLK